MPAWNETQANEIIARHAGPRRRAAADPARLAGGVRLRARRPPCRWSPRRSTSRAPRCMASSPSTTTSATQPAGRHVLKLCRAEACQAMGGERWRAERAASARRRAGARPRRTARVTLEPVYCLGLCACAPVRDARRRADRPARRRTRSTTSSREVRPMTARIFVPARCRRRCAVGADEVAAAIARRGRGARARRRDRAQRLARPVLAGAAGRGRDAGRPHRLRAGDAPSDVAGLFDAGLARRRRASAVRSAGRRRFPS